MYISEKLELLLSQRGATAELLKTEIVATAALYSLLCHIGITEIVFL